MNREIWQRRGAMATAALVAVALVVGLPATANAQRLDDQARSRVAVYASGVDFVPEVSYQKAVLTVSGNGKVYRQEFTAGRRPSIGMFDPDGQLLADGRYSWQIELLPTEATAAGMRAAAERGDSFERWTAESGSFTISNGAFADTALTEEAPPRPFTRAVADTASAAGDRPAQGDDDASVGSRSGFERQLNAAAVRQTPAVVRGVLSGPDRVAEDSDAAAAKRPAAAAITQTPALRYIPTPRSDGSNGRPRS